MSPVAKTPGKPVLTRIASSSSAGFGSSATSRRYLAMNKGLLVLDQTAFDKWSRRNYTTPELIWAGFAVVTVFSIAFFTYSFSSINTASKELQTVCVDATPSVELAQKIRADISELNAEELNFCLVNKNNYDPNIAKEADFNREKIAEEIINAARNIKATYGSEEQAALTQIVRIYTNYESLMTAAGSMFEQKNTAQGLVLEQEANQLLHQKLFPFVDELDQANSSQLDKAYSDSEADSTKDIVIMLVFGGILVFFLVAYQVWLADRTNRMFNPGLVLATGSAVSFIVYASWVQLSSAQLMHRATKDCFLSIHVLLQAKAYANDANADQIRWLLDTSTRDSSLADFEVNSHYIFSPGIQSLQDDERIYQNDSKPDSAIGSLADELENITFPGEKDAALASLTSWGKYLEACELTRTQALRKAASPAPAVVNDTASNDITAFQIFTSHLDDTYQINEKYFLQAREDGFQVLNYSEPLCFITLAAVLSFTFIGIWPRLKEYRY